MKKRIFALIMAMCLALSLLPASVFAENESGSDVVYGTYGTGETWTQDKKGTGTIEYKTGDGNTITLSKKATPLGDNTYRIDLGQDHPDHHDHASRRGRDRAGARYLRLDGLLRRVWSEELPRIRL